jgi:hypothetical protein
MNRELIARKWACDHYVVSSVTSLIGHKGEWLQNLLK